jgi:hypothetical protein
MDKIYCKNCKYFYCAGCRVGVAHPLFNEIYKDHTGVIKKRWKNKRLFIKLTGSESYGHIFPVDQYCTANKNYECPMYKRKWWKFWIKPKEGPKNVLVELLKEVNKNENK